MSRLRAEGNLDFDGFTDVVHRLLKAAWGDDWGTFCEAFPNGTNPNSVKLPVITYSLREMRPGHVGNTQTREIKPRLRGEYKAGESGDSNPPVTQVYGQVMDCEVVFEIWEENNAKATVLAKRFRDFMRTYTGFMMQKGVQQLIFDYQNNEQETRLRDNAICRKQVYYVRLEDQYIVPSDVIAKVTGTVNASYDTADNSINRSRIDFKLP